MVHEYDQLEPVIDGRCFAELEVRKGLSGWAFGPHPLGCQGVGEEAQVAKAVDLGRVESVDKGGASFRLSLSYQKGVDSRERSLCRVPDGVLVGSGDFSLLLRIKSCLKGAAKLWRLREGMEGTAGLSRPWSFFLWHQKLLRGAVRVFALTLQCPWRIPG